MTVYVGDTIYWRYSSETKLYTERKLKIIEWDDWHGETNKYEKLYNGFYLGNNNFIPVQMTRTNEHLIVDIHATAYSLITKDQKAITEFIEHHISCTATIILGES